MATTFYLWNTTDVSGAPGTPPDSGAFYAMSEVAPSSGTLQFVTSTSTGPVTPPTAGTHVTVTAAGTKVTWVSDPLEAFTWSGSTTVSVNGKESNVNANVARIWARVGKLDTGGTFTWALSGVTSTSELTNSNATYTASGTPTSTSFADGDRLVCELYLDDAASVTMGSGYTVTYNAGTSLWLRVSETVNALPWKAPYLGGSYYSGGSPGHGV